MLERDKPSDIMISLYIAEAMSWLLYSTIAREDLRHIDYEPNSRREVLQKMLRPVYAIRRVTLGELF